jgi:predicted AlkP superfamily pyrophosphatase or phosphodiesterase
MTRAVVISIDGFAGFYWGEPGLRIPTLRRLAERGVVAPRMDAVFPTTTWPTHVSLVTGVRPRTHGVVGNHILDRKTGLSQDLTGDPVYDASEILRVPTIYDRAHDAGRTTAAVDWPCTRHAAGLDWNLPFFKDQRVFETHTAREVWRELAGLGYPMERQGEWAQLPKRFLKDAMVADVAAHLLRGRRPDLLLLHFLCADSHQHLFGPRSPEAWWAIEYIDGLIGRVLDALPGGALDRDTAVFVVSDHGFLPSDREIRVNVHLRRRGLLGVDADGRVTRAEARLVMNHGAGYVYLDGGGDRDRLARDLARELAGLEGVAGAWAASEYAGLGLATPAENALAGDLILEAAPGYCFGDETRGEEVHGPPKYRGTHGQRPEHPDNAAFFLAAGAGVRKAAALPRITSRDVAPTLAAVLGLTMGPVEGRRLDEALV